MKEVATVFKALGDEVRLEIVRLLVGKKLCVCNIIAAFAKSQPTISHHLKVLKYAGIVEDTRDGKWIYYRLVPEAFQIIDEFLASLRPTLTQPIRTKHCD